MTTEINKKTWTSDKSENQEYKQIRKLTPQTIYNIIDVKSIKTKFGDNYMLIDEDNERFYSNKKLNEFIKTHRNIKKFTLETLEEKEFTITENKKKKIIKYFDVKISYD
jgi:hypothetical protein